ncbi:hypothetical protein HDU92_006321 [Lobulomyces angularis]|nr:hypothetical protein HDU92_006321 [Lobulomyces angularis]
MHLPNIVEKRICQKMDVAVTTSTSAPTTTNSSNAITPSPIPFRVIPSMYKKNVRFELTNLYNKWWDFYIKKNKNIFHKSEIVEVTADRCSPMNTLAKRYFDCLSSSHSTLNHRHFTVPCFRQYISPVVHFIWEIEKLQELFFSSTPLADTQLLGATIAFLWLMEVIENQEIVEEINE